MSFSFGNQQTNQSSGFTFGQPQQQQQQPQPPARGFGFGISSGTGGFGLEAPTTTSSAFGASPFSFSTPNASMTNFSFGPVPQPAGNTTFGFGTTTPATNTTAANSGFSFGQPAATTSAGSTGFNFAQPSNFGSTGFSFAAPKTTAATSSAFSFNTPASSSITPSLGNTGFNFAPPNISSSATFGAPAFNFAGPTTTTPAITSTPIITTTSNIAGSTAGENIGGIVQSSAMLASSGGSFLNTSLPTNAIQPAALGSNTSGLTFDQNFQAAAPFSFGLPTTASATSTAAPPSAGFNFGFTAPVTTVAATSLLAPVSTTAVVTSIPAPAVSATPVATTSTVVPPPAFPTLSTSGSSNIFGSSPASTAASTTAPTSLPVSFPTTKRSLVTTAPAFGGTPFSFGSTSTTAPTTTTATTATSSTVPIIPTPSLSISATTPQVSLTSTTSVTSSSTTPSTTMNFRQLEDVINKWKMELEEQERIFLNQATQVNAWDRLLISNGEKITTLSESVECVKLDQQRLDNELDYILAQQRELEDLLAPLEKNIDAPSGLTGQQHADLEREATYHLTENIDAQLKRMAENIKEIIEHLNANNKNQDESDPIFQISKILNAHMDALQWIEESTTHLQRKIEENSKIFEVQKREQEKSYRLGYP